MKKILLPLLCLSSITFVSCNNNNGIWQKLKEDTYLYVYIQNGYRSYIQTSEGLTGPKEKDIKYKVITTKQKTEITIKYKYQIGYGDTYEEKTDYFYGDVSYSLIERTTN